MGRMGHLFLKLFRVHACVYVRKEFSITTTPTTPLHHTKWYFCIVLEEHEDYSQEAWGLFSRGVRTIPGSGLLLLMGRMGQMGRYFL